MCELMRSSNAVASSLVAKVQVKAFAHFHAVTIKYHSGIQNGLLGLQE
jgi:hypothetical protein